MSKRFLTIEQALIALADAVPPLFFRLKSLAEALHAEEGVSAPERAVLRDLTEGPAASTPTLAAMRGVTRQAVQPVVDRLLDRGLIAERPNPIHKRSPLLAATPAGADMHGRLRLAERAALADAARNLTVHEINAALDAIELVTKLLAEKDPPA
jgi:DNA-binding MarR family transcriptional regulator